MALLCSLFPMFSFGLVYGYGFVGSFAGCILCCVMVFIRQVAECFVCSVVFLSFPFVNKRGRLCVHLGWFFICCVYFVILFNESVFFSYNVSLKTDCDKNRQLAVLPARFVFLLNWN